MRTRTTADSMAKEPRIQSIERWHAAYERGRCLTPFKEQSDIRFLLNLAYKYEEIRQEADLLVSMLPVHDRIKNEQIATQVRRLGKALRRWRLE